MADLRQSGSLKILFPRAIGPALQAVLVNTAGGVTGGDEFSLSLRAEPMARLTVTTQAAERAYRAKPAETGTIRNRIFVGNEAHVNWLPQETILYQGCSLHRSMAVDLADGASLLLAEPLVFGRMAMGETLCEAHFRDRIDIRRNGAPLFLDSMHLAGDIAGHLALPNVASGAGALASLVYIAPDAESRLAPVRALLPETAGASLIREDVLFLRTLAPDSFVLRQSLIPILTLLSGSALPRPWMI